MSEIVDFVRHRSSLITPVVLKRVVRELPLLKAEFTQINAPQFPHLVDQLEFLADVVEDFSEGLLEDLPYSAAASATFALIYAHQIVDLIPDNSKHGHDDDSSVVRGVLLLHEKAFSNAAEKLGIPWSQVTSKP